MPSTSPLPPFHFVPPYTARSLIIPMGALAQNTMVAPKTMAFCDVSTKANLTTLDAYWKQELGGRQIYFMKVLGRRVLREGPAGGWREGEEGGKDGKQWDR